jgi:hypothetical protein
LHRTTATISPCIAIIFRRVRKTAKNSVRLHETTRLPIDGFWWNSIFECYSKICRQNSSLNKNWQKITDILHEGLCAFMIIFRSVLLRIRNISDKSCRENQNTHFILNNFFRKSCRLWDNSEKHDTARQTTDDRRIHRMRFACFITKATDAHSEYVIFIAFPRQQRLCERASILRYTHNTALFKFIIQFFCQSYCCHDVTHTVKNIRQPSMFWTKPKIYSSVRSAKKTSGGYWERTWTLLTATKSLYFLKASHTKGNNIFAQRLILTNLEDLLPSLNVDHTQVS